MIGIIYVIFSFILDGIISNFINFSLNDISYFKTIYSIISLVIVYNYFYNKKKYLCLVLIMGILFDIVYTGTFLVNVILFLIISLIGGYLDERLSNNIITINFKCLLGISLYHLFSYVIFLIFHFNKYNLYLLGDIVIRSMIMTVIYTSISYLILEKVYKKR